MLRSHCSEEDLSGLGRRGPQSRRGCVAGSELGYPCCKEGTGHREGSLVGRGCMRDWVGG